MKAIAVLLNLGVLVFVGISVAISTVPPIGDKGFWLIVLFTVTPLCSLVAFLRKSHHGDHRSFLSLYFERRRLEEQKRIDSLKGA